MNAISRHPGDAEAQAAIAGLHEQTISHNLTLRLGRTVRVPKAFGGGYQIGTIAQRSEDRHLGVVWRVDTPEGRLVLLQDEIEVI